MMADRFSNWIIAVLNCTGALLLLCAALDCGHYAPGNDVQRELRVPLLFPYAQGTTIPPNIAPLNFVIKEKGERFFVTISKNDTPAIAISSATSSIVIPSGKWSALLGRSKGSRIGITVCCRTGGLWRRYETIWDTVAAEEIDRYVVYRRIPVCKDWTFMGFYQRDLQGFEERMIFHNSGSGACFHCHSFRNNSAGRMVLEFRSKAIGTPMLLGTSEGGLNTLKAINTKTPFSTGKAGFVSWHPEKDLLAFTMNRFQMFFNAAGLEPREVFDAEASIALYDYARNTVIHCPDLSKMDRLQTFPSWSKDGRHLYFCSAPRLPEARCREIRCDLMRMAFDPAEMKRGVCDTVLTAIQAGGSVLQPECSPDGRSLLVTLAPYGDFPIDKVCGRLALVDLKTSSIRVLDSGARWTDGWHCWAKSGRWIVFTSKRANNRFASPWVRYVDDSGTVHAPFILPQRDPAWFESSIIAYTMPEFTTDRIPFSFAQIRNSLETCRRNAATAAADSASYEREREF